MASLPPPTSVVNTPAVHSIFPGDEKAARVKYISSAENQGSVGLPSELRPVTANTSNTREASEDYFSRPLSRFPPPERNFNFWRDLPSELRTEILTYLEPREIVRCAVVSRAWSRMCFDGQLWACVDTTGFYQSIPADALIKIITTAGPFARDLNLRGCVQLRNHWRTRGLPDVCKNLENICLEGCRIDRTSVHDFVHNNERLLHANFCGLDVLSNTALGAVATSCPRLEHLNVSWCKKVSASGMKKVVEGCGQLKDLRASETRGWGDLEMAQLIFERNTLERLVLMNCDDLTDESLAVMIEGRGSEMDYITGRPSVPPRRLQHLDLTRCMGITDHGVRTLVNNVPDMEGLQLSKLHGITDATLVELLPTTPSLTRLDLEELEDLTNAVMVTLAQSACAARLRHLSISYCEHIGDVGMLPVLKACTRLRSLEMDNTRISDLVLIEASSLLRHRSPRTVVDSKTRFVPRIGLRLVAYDCQNVTWTGVREVLSRNAETVVTTHTTELPPLEKKRPVTPTPQSASDMSAPLTPLPCRIHITRSTSYPSEVTQLKCFYTYQPTVEEHTKRVLRGDWSSARRLERKWADFMMAQEEAGVGGAGAR